MVPERPDLSAGGGPGLADPRGHAGLTARVWLLVLAALIFGLIVVALVPRAKDGGTEPPVGLLLLGGVLIALVTVPALYVAIRREMKIPASVALYAVAYNAAIVLVKFTLAPKGMYDVNQTVNFTGFFTPSDPIGAVSAAVGVFLIYFIVYGLIYRVYRARLRRFLSLPEPERTRRLRRSVIPLVVGAILLSMVGGAGILFLPLVAVSSGAEYLRFVFASGLSLFISLVLAGATTLVVLAFRGAGEQARVIGDAALLVSFFWIGLVFLAIYHVLWVVYVLMLTTVWPLKVVVPK
jgi:hypothetical protein